MWRFIYVFFSLAFYLFFFRQILMRARCKWCPGSIAAEIMTAASSQQIWGFSHIVLVPQTSQEARDQNVCQPRMAQGGRKARHCCRSSPKEQHPDTAEHSVLLTSPHLLHQQIGPA